MDLDTYELVLLRRPPDAPTYDDTELDRIQDRHLAFLDEQRDAGLLVLAGCPAGIITSLPHAVPDRPGPI